MGRPVRCTGCRKPFILRENGQAEKVEERPKTTSTHSATPRRSVSEQIAVEVKRQSGADREESDEYAPHSKAVANDRTDSELFPATASVDHQTDAAISRKGEGTDSQSARSRSSARLNAKQQRTRRIMAKNLSEAATMALTKVSERTEAVQRKASDRLGSDRITRKGHAGKASDGTELGPAVLTGEGEAELKNRRNWFVGLIALVVAAMLAWFVLSDGSPQRQLVQKWSEPAANGNWAYPFRMPTMRERALSGGAFMPVFADLSNASLSGVSEWQLDPIGVLSATEYVWYARRDCLVPQDGIKELQAALAGGTSFDEAIAGLSLDKGEVITRQRFEELAQGQGWPEAAVNQLWLAFELAANPAPHPIDKVTADWLAGDWPEFVEVVTIKGEGLLLEDTGSGYRLRDASYHGLLIRGDGFSEHAEFQVDGWAVWSLAEGP